MRKELVAGIGFYIGSSPSITDEVVAIGAKKGCWSPWALAQPNLVVNKSTWPVSLHRWRAAGEEREANMDQVILFVCAFVRV